MSIRRRLGTWPVVRQLTGGDRLGRGTAVRSARTEELTPRTRTADRMVKSICPYCAVGCGQRVYVKRERVVQIEGDPDSPISRGRLCPKGSASEQLVNSPSRVTTVKYRRPYGTDWEDLPLERAMEMIADSEAMVSLEVVEINPILDEHTRTALLGVELVLSALGQKIL